MSESTLRIGDILVDSGAISRLALDQQLSQIRGRIGNWLRTHNLVSGVNLARGLAQQYGVGFADFTMAPPDVALFTPRDMPHYLAHHYVPYARDGKTLVVATTEPSTQLQRQLEQRHGCPVALVATGPYDLNNYFATIAATTSHRTATLALRRKHRHLTADRTLVPQQFIGVGIAVMLPFLVVALLPHYGWQSLLLACNLFYFASLYAKIQLFTHGKIYHKELRRNEAKLTASIRNLTPESLPIYSILVPLYKESSAVMARLIRNLNALDYPREKLDIKLVCEADDHNTLAALKALQPPATMQIICVPPGLPRTKPKACNIALQHATGEFLVIYDAEDHPAPDQLKRAVASFADASEDVACFQAALNYYNRDENLLTRLFAIEYSALFKLHLPALERLHIPIPLGGTSNHLRISALRAVGGWDAFNVTEDADLGIRLAYFGYETRVLSSTTMEESPITLDAWRKQRTRWIKGYIQTWLVYMRDRRTLKQRLGAPAYYGFQFFIGAPALTFLLAPFFWLVFLASFLGIIPAHLHPFIQGICVVSLIAGIACSLVYAREVLRMEGWHHLRHAMLAYPFYWVLHSVAAGCALTQLVRKPHYWAKTQHGICKTTLTA